MKHHIRAWAMRWLNLTPTEYVAGLRERNDDLEDRVCCLRTQLAETDAWLTEYRSKAIECRRTHYRGALKSVLIDVEKMEANGGHR